MSIRRVIQIPRPSSSRYSRPITAHLFFAPHASKLAESTELILDIPGGGFVSMTPEHHEERLCAWAEKTGRPVLSLDYGKAPECKWNLVSLRQSSRPRSGSPIGIVVSGVWELSGKLCDPCGADVLLGLPGQIPTEWWTLISFVTSQIPIHTQWMRSSTLIRFLWTPLVP